MAFENTLVHLEPGGAKLTVESGGTLNLATGSVVTANGTHVAAITNALTAGSATAADCATQLNLVIAALRSLKLIAT